jgi:hypothetical protein
VEDKASGRALKTHSERNPRRFLRGQASEYEIDTSIGFEAPRGFAKGSFEKSHLFCRFFARPAHYLNVLYSSTPRGWSFLSDLYFQKAIAVDMKIL